MKYHFCTFFDSNYLTRGLALYRSLSQHVEDFVLYIVCLDDLTEEVLEKLNIPNIEIIPLGQIEQSEPQLLEAKSNRSLIEYYFTLSPVVPSYIFDHFPEVNLISYMDSDLYFYSDVKPIFDELGDSSILIVEHRFPEHLKYKEKFGRFNVQFQVFRRDDEGLRCLKEWKRQCVEWCYDYLDGERFADQKYLDRWLDEFHNLKVLQHKGAGLAPWNWMQYDIRMDGDQIIIDGQNLIFYHFHGMKMINSKLIFHGQNYYDRVMPVKLKNKLYGDYVRKLRSVSEWVRRTVGTRTNISHCDQRLGHSKVRLVLSGLKNNQLIWV